MTCAILDRIYAGLLKQSTMEAHVVEIAEGPIDRENEQQKQECRMPERSEIPAPGKPIDKIPKTGKDRKDDDNRSPVNREMSFELWNEQVAEFGRNRREKNGRNEHSENSRTVFYYVTPRRGDGDHIFKDHVTK